MKYALIVFSSLIFCLSFEAQARTITSFKKSPAIIGLAQFLYEVAPDLPESVRLSDRKINSIDFTQCNKVSSADVLETLERSIRHVLRYFPDEEVPFEQAIYDLEDYLAQSTYYQCNIIKKTKFSHIKSSYFVDDQDRIHLRLDRITPIHE